MAKATEVGGQIGGGSSGVYPKRIWKTVSVQQSHRGKIVYRLWIAIL